MLVSMYKYVDQRDLGAMLDVKSSAGVAPEVNLGNLSHASDNRIYPKSMCSFPFN